MGEIIVVSLFTTKNEVSFGEFFSRVIFSQKVYVKLYHRRTTAGEGSNDMSFPKLSSGGTRLSPLILRAKEFCNESEALQRLNFLPFMILKLVSVL